MEDRVIIALCVLAVMIVTSTWLVVSRIRAKRAFERRQLGRGKTSGD